MVNKIVKYFIASLLVFNISVIYAQEDKVIDDKNINNSGYKCIIEDDADILTEEEEYMLYDQMLPLTKFGHIAFKSISYNAASTSDYAAYYYHSHFYNDSGTLFLIDMDNREIYIFSDGENYKIITSNKAYSITDNVYRRASYGNYFGCASDAFKQISDLLNGYKILEPMRYISNALIAIIISAFINLFIVMSKAKIRISSEEELIKNSTVSFNINQIEAKKTDSKSVYHPPSDYSGGGSFGGGGGSFGGGGGGFSSGGGGGHGF